MMLISSFLTPNCASLILERKVQELCQVTPCFDHQLPLTHIPAASQLTSNCQDPDVVAILTLQPYAMWQRQSVGPNRQGQALAS